MKGFLNRIGLLLLSGLFISSGLTAMTLQNKSVQLQAVITTLNGILDAAGGSIRDIKFSVSPNVVTYTQGLLSAQEVAKLNKTIKDFNRERTVFARKTKNTFGLAILALLKKANAQAAREIARAAVVAQPPIRHYVPAPARGERYYIDLNAPRDQVAPARIVHDGVRPQPLRETAPAPEEEDAVACPLCFSTAQNLRDTNVQLLETNCCDAPLCTECVARIESPRQYNPNIRDYELVDKKCPYCRARLLTKPIQEQ